MATALSVAHTLPAAPDAVFALITDREFLEGQLAETGGGNPEVVKIETVDGVTTVVTRQSIPSSVLPSMVASMIPGDPVTERTEVWKAEGDGYAATIAVVVKGAPASIKGTMALTPAAGGSSLAVNGSAAVPIPMFGGKVEAIIVEQVGKLLASEAEYTAQKLA